MALPTLPAWATSYATPNASIQQTVVYEGNELAPFDLLSLPADHPESKANDRRQEEADAERRLRQESDTGEVEQSTPLINVQHLHSPTVVWHAPV